MIKNQNGASLVEVIVAMFILALVMIGLNAATLCLIKTNYHSKQLSAATSTAYNLFEEFRATNYSDIKSKKDTLDNRFVRKCDVKDSVSFKLITITISWPVITESHKVDFSTIISKR